MLALTVQETTCYPDPTITEMVGLAVDFGIACKVRRFNGRMRMEVLGEHLDLSEEEAALMLKGLLLGYFYNQKRDDLSLAQWES